MGETPAPHTPSLDSFIRKRKDEEVERRLEEAEQRSLNLWERVFGRNSMEDQVELGDYAWAEEEDTQP